MSAAMASAACIGYWSANLWQWNLFLRCRQYFVNQVADSPVTEQLCSRAMDLAPTLAAPATSIDQVNAAVVRSGPVALLASPHALPTGSWVRLGLFWMLAFGAAWLATARRDRARSRRVLAALGVFRIAVFFAIGAAVWYLTFPRAPAPRPLPAAAYAFVPGFPAILILAALLGALIAARTMAAARRSACSLCPMCSYPLTGITGGPCPECGTDPGVSRLAALRARLRCSFGFRVAVIVMITVTGALVFLLALSDRAERSSIVHGAVRWLTLRGDAGAGSLRGKPVAVVPIPAGRPVLIQSDSARVVVLISEGADANGQPLLVFGAAVSDKPFITGQPDGWTFTTGLYPSPGPQERILAETPTLRLSSDFWRILVGPDQFRHVVHVARGRITRVAPLHAAAPEQSVAEELRRLAEVTLHPNKNGFDTQDGARSPDHP